MVRALSLTLCLLLPISAFADEAPTPAPSADAPTQSALVPTETAAPQPAVAEARSCGMHHCAGGGRGKWLVLTGVAGTVLTAVAIGVAVSVARSHDAAVIR